MTFNNLKLLALAVASFLTACSGSPDKNKSVETLDSNVSSPVVAPPTEEAMPYTSEVETSSAKVHPYDSLALHLADFLVPMKQDPQYLISKNIPEILEKKGFRKGKRGPGKSIIILGDKGKQYDTPFTRNYDGSEQTAILMELSYEFEGEKMSLPGIEIRFSSAEEKDAFLSEADDLKYLRKGSETGDDAVYSDIGDLRIYTDGNTVTIKYCDYPW